MPYTFEWDSGNLSKLELVRLSGRIVYEEEIESVFDDIRQIITLTYSDPKTGEERFMITDLSNQSRVISVIFVVRQPGDRIRVVNVWKAKGAKLKEYENQT